MVRNQKVSNSEKNAEYFLMPTERTMANLVLHMYAAANTVMTVKRILVVPGFVIQVEYRPN